MKEALAIIFVFVGCCSNVVFLELLVKEDPSSGHIITFAQFLFIALEGFLDYSILVVMFFVASVCNNYAFNFNIPMPLHMIFRAGSLIANMVMGVIILKKKYTFSKYLSVFMITLGIVICTIVSGKEVKSTQPPGKEDASNTTEFQIFFWWVVGIILLTVALFVSARMGIYQETLYGRYGKHPKEALFYTHLLPLPGFLLIFNDIYSHLYSFAESESVPVPVLGFYMPKLYIYVCISSVYVLTTECSSLTVTLVVTLRKFTSLLFSILYFQNEFTIHHWIGTLLVFTGTLIFTEIMTKIKQSISDKRKVE
ncbi:UDP-xylose and UDP-N-acetylglucosamine transporter [Gryllus bimaculatus]|nr:UDP-xylose and UDP-N-acetylglucosamine transporter [Gryllus bimaculatus]